MGRPKKNGTKRKKTAEKIATTSMPISSSLPADEPFQFHHLSPSQKFPDPSHADVDMQTGPEIFNSDLDAMILQHGLSMPGSQSAMSSYL
jgi:hypothetical protein